MRKILLPALLLGCFILAGRFLFEMAGDAQAGLEATKNGDVNASGDIDLSDAVYLINWLFLGGPAPAAIAGAPELEERLAAVEKRLEELAGGIPAGEAPEEAAFRRLMETVSPGSTQPPLPRGTLRPVPGGVPAGQYPAQLLIDGKPFGQVTGFIVEEKVSKLPTCRVEVQVAGSPPDPAAFIDRPAQVQYVRAGRRTTFAGIIGEFSLSAFDGSRGTCAVTLASPLSRLERRSGNRIFQGDSVPQVVQRILDEHDLQQATEFRLGIYELREYCVQYQESDLNFIQRLMEEEGIFFFPKGDGSDKIVFADSAAGYGAAPPGPFIYRGTAGVGAGPDEEFIRTVERRTRSLTGKTLVQEYDFEVPRLKETSASAPDGQGEQHEFHSSLLSLQNAAAVRLAELQGMQKLSQGTSNAGDLRAGRLVDVAGTASPFNGKYLVTGVRHVYVGHDQPGGYAHRFGNDFTCIPAAQPFRPARITPRPRVGGPQTAIVTGPAGEEIYTDKYGRVKVKFHWDRSGAKNDTSSGWIRVQQLSTGSMFLPEVGDEVLVVFEQGDIDRPIVIGSLWNGRDLPPYLLPTNKDLRVIAARRLELNSPTTSVQGSIASTKNADPAPRVSPGQLHRDNAIVAWARVAAEGTPGKDEFGVRSVTREGPGVYLIALDVVAESAAGLIPMAVPETKGPIVRGGARLLSIQAVDAGRFRVVMVSDLGEPADGGFVFMATAR